MTVGTNDLCFNHVVKIGTMFLRNGSVLHMVDTATHFCTVAILKYQSIAPVWITILSQRILVYSGPPDYLEVDQGSGFVSRKIR